MRKNRPIFAVLLLHFRYDRAAQGGDAVACLILDNAYRLMGSLKVERGRALSLYISPAWAPNSISVRSVAAGADDRAISPRKPKRFRAICARSGPEIPDVHAAAVGNVASAVEAQMMMDAGPWPPAL